MLRCMLYNDCSSVGPMLKLFRWVELCILVEVQKQLITHVYMKYCFHLLLYRLQSVKRNLTEKAEDVGRMQTENVDMSEEIEELQESHKYVFFI